MLRSFVEELGDGRIAGGCDHCDAYQRMREDEHGIYHVTVHHDDWCPFLARRAKR